MKYCVCTMVNDKFARGCEVMLYSFLSNNSWFDGDVVVICGKEGSPMPLSEDSKERIGNIYHKTIFKEYEYSDFFDIINKVQNFALAGTESLLYKFPVFEMEEYDRILFLDSDLLIIGDIKELFDNDAPFTACPDRCDAAYNDTLWHKRTEEYYNMGLFVVNKPYIHKGMINEFLSLFDTIDFTQITRWNPHHGNFVDQDTFNAYFLDKGAVVAPASIYNFDRFRFDDGNNDRAKIVHYLEPNKPWEGCTSCASTDVWKEYEKKYETWLSYYYFRWGEIIRDYPKKYEDKDKYIVVTCAKGENDYIREWVEHYLNLGFDKIFICDNNDDASLCDVLSDYMSNGSVERIDCHRMKLFQDGIYKMFIENGNFKWCGLFDCDEFLELGVYSNIKDYLSTKEEDCIAFNWLMFGSNGKMKSSNLPLAERFTMPKLPIINIYNSFLKCIIRGGHFKYKNALGSGGHVPTYSNGITYNIGGYYKAENVPVFFQSAFPLRYKEGYIKHYYTKSFDEWINKARRGWPDKHGNLPYHRYFFLKDKESLTAEDYRFNLFIDDDNFARLSDGPLKWLKDENHEAVRIKNDSNILYAFVARTMYIMSRVTGKIFLLDAEWMEDECFTLLLECGFVTGNKVVCVKNEKEELLAFNKYKKNKEQNIYMTVNI